MKIQKVVPILLHILFWVGWIWFFNTITVLQVVENIEITDTGGKEVVNNTSSAVRALPFILIGVIVKAILGYALIYLWRNSKIRKSALLLFLPIGFCVLYLGFHLENFLADTILLQNGRFEEIHLDIWSSANFLQYVVFACILSSYLVVDRLIVIDKFLLETKQQKLQAELAFLKYQLNPHLLFNTLNTLFSMAQKEGADEVSDGILKLSEMMRYMLYETKNDRISLSKEVQFIEQLIELQKLRFSDRENLTVNFTVSGDAEQRQIPPMLLTPFIENAFKHGVHPSQTSIIDIILKVEEQNLKLHVKNSIFRKLPILTENEGGVGIENLKQRLEILFPDRYLLDQHEKDGSYVAILSIEFDSRNV